MIRFFGRPFQLKITITGVFQDIQRMAELHKLQPENQEKKL